MSGSSLARTQGTSRSCVFSPCQRRRKPGGFGSSVGPVALLCHRVSVSVSASDRVWVRALAGCWMDGSDCRQLIGLNQEKIEQRGTDGPEGPSGSSVVKTEPSPGFRGGDSSASTRSGT